jgi:hypothetical protein
LVARVCDQQHDDGQVPVAADAWRLENMRGSDLGLGKETNVIGQSPSLRSPRRRFVAL